MQYIELYAKFFFFSFYLFRLSIRLFLVENWLINRSNTNYQIKGFIESNEAVVQGKPNHSLKLAGKPNFTQDERKGKYSKEETIFVAIPKF